MKKIVFQNEPIDISQNIHEVMTESNDSVVSFVGRIQNKSSDKPVLHVEYQAYCEMARKELNKAIDNATEKWRLKNCLIIHRFGSIQIGETSIVVAVSSPDHSEAFLAAQYLIDIVKRKVPIWKKEFYSDGSSWTNEKQ